MNRRLTTIIAFVGLAFLPSIPAQDERVGTEAFHRVATGLRAIAHEGCVTRGAHWSGQLRPGKRVLVPLFLFKGIDYFIVIAPDRGTPDPKLDCRILDVVSVPVRSQEVRGKNRIVLTVRPKKTGRKYVSLLLPEGSEVANVAVGYAYR